MILLITSCVAPPMQPNLILSDPQIRCKETIKGLIFFIKSGTFDKIVLCDNSGFTFNNDELTALATNYNVSLEILTFVGDSSKVKERGKGYGEGEIMKYILENSYLLKTEDFFFKITGKLFVVNIEDIVKRINKRKNYFNITTLKWFGAIDTRFYGVNKQVFIDVLLCEYLKVNDKEMMWYEICFRDALKKASISFNSFPIYPIIYGLSGTQGVEFMRDDINYKYHELLTKLGVHNSFFSSFSSYILLKITALLTFSK
ncbi:hypothetical protein KTG24_21680 [Bacteroides fragilis]|uniref:hypothetical protein n=1 Tax=Bacteroides fragilis TaxID=817 RepID=UPI001C2226B9|nr:hypothetical protein [Bacteroides fragilis]MBU9020391.1 hypothetical protein [Bacteroides fragilis]MBU9024837.1 hypothetical protein [Bacteroides fragilis]MBU9085334.1 hypothetical protein [Bacteroides fragilis]